jgi:hypothetical protein
VLFFIAAQLLINFKHGVVFSPFYHYGMYSSVIKSAKTYEIVEVNVNGKNVQAKDFSPQKWDKISLPVWLNNQQQQWNQGMYHNTIQRLLHTKDSSVYINNYTQKDFDNWYRNYLENMLDTKIDSIKTDIKTVAF